MSCGRSIRKSEHAVLRAMKAVMAGGAIREHILGKVTYSLRSVWRRAKQRGDLFKKGTHVQKSWRGKESGNWEKLCNFGWTGVVEVRRKFEEHGASRNPLVFSVGKKIKTPCWI